MKTLKKIFAGLCLATMFFAVSCSSDDDSESKSQTEKTGGTQNPPQSNVNINQILIALGAGNGGQAKSFKPSATAPASGVETKKIHNDIDTAVVWLDGTTIYYYAKGIPLGDSAKEMFKECGSLETIDMTGFDTSNVTDMSDMFHNCNSLTTIYAKADADWSSVTEDASRMFLGCEKIKGGNGTTYLPDHNNAEYARVDGLNGNPGYFTTE